MIIKLARPVAERSKSGTRAPLKKSPWHAVSVVRGRSSCAAVCELNGQRWLSTQAPQLPVTGCNSVQCSCHYRHHEDRRVQDRREAGVLISSPPPTEGERRSRHMDRRMEDSIQ